MERYFGGPAARYLLLGSGLSCFAWLRYLTRKAMRPNLRPLESEHFTAAEHNSGNFIELSKGRTFYRSFNEHCSLTVPPIVLCHGFIGSSEYLMPLINALLPTQRRIYALDLYGRGQSDCVDTDNSYDLFVEQMKEFLDKVDVSCPIELIGYSMGGGVAVHFSAQNLVLLHSLTLIAPVGLPSMTNGPSFTLKCLLGFLKCGSRALYGGYLHEWIAGKVLKPDDRMLQEGWSRVDTPRYAWFKEHMTRRFDREKHTLPRAVASTILSLPFDGLTDSYAFIGQSSLPVLVMWGEKDKSVPCDSTGVQGLVPQAKIILWPEEGHMLPVELAEEVGEHIVEFLV